ncbi:MAG: tRNA threonylcarbamoyladenosine dehydratase [Clostridia bacterium]|nr:tRNA threonylcarbamoyladenosine dehydratase [Clostridia bacterium]
MRRVYGEKGMERLAASRVIVFGTGGVGGHAAEALARGGVGHITVVDGDKVDESNMNRQIVSTAGTLGRLKAEAMRERMLAAAPGADVTAVSRFVTEENVGEFGIEGSDFVLDCVDDRRAKLAIIREAKQKGVRVISAMGAGNKRHPEMFEVADIERTSVCPLARAMRQMLRREGISGVPVGYSKETPEKTGDGPVGSTSFTPGVMGMIMAGYAINELTGRE